MSMKSQSGNSSMASKLRKGVSSKMSDDGLDDDVIMDDKGVIKRKSRNLSEKKRRDQFNILINELCSMVCTGKRKMDKSTILKSAISFIRNHNQVTMQSHCQEATQEDWKPSFLSNEEFTHLMLEALDEFIMVFSVTGKILYISENITSLLGHTPNDLIGSSITDLVWDEECSMLESLLGSWGSDFDQNQGSLENHINLSCHLRRRNMIDSDVEKNYELVHFSGYLRVQGNPELACTSRLSSSWGDDSKESTNYGDALSQYNGLVFVASARLQTPQLLVEMSIVDVSKSEFTSRHSLEWKFLFLDHRGPPIIGYLPFEVLGTSGYDYYHIDDLDKVTICHEALMQKGEVTSCCYRFLTKGQQWIWLQTKYYITYHQWYSKPEFIVCTHRVISYNEVAGHPMKLENEDADHQAPETPSNSLDFETRKSRTEGKSISQQNSKNKSAEKIFQEDSNSFDSTKRTAGPSSMNRERVKSNRHNFNQRYYQQQRSNSSASDAQQPESPTCGGGDSVLLSPPPPLPSNESISQQHSRHPSGSSRVGTALSDTGSISSSGSFQSAASQHSRQSDQSMHSLHSQQSHTSMQSVHNQQHQQQVQQAQQTQSTSRSSSRTCSVHSCVNTSHQHHVKQTSASNYTAQQHFSSANISPYKSTTHLSRSGETEADVSVPASGSVSSTMNAGHRFLQPRANNVSAIRRVFTASGGSAVSAPSNSASNDGATEQAFSYRQSVVPIDSNTLQSGSVLPVQRIIEGLPVVTLPGIVTHEPVVLTAAQRNLHEQLRLKHMEIQQSIMAQQEELRRVSEKLILAQYGAWGPTVLKMAVPYSSEGSDGSSTQPAHAVLSTGGLLTCLSTETPFSLGQISSTPQLAAGGSSNIGAMSFSPGTPILVHSPEFHAQSPPERNSNESGNASTDPSQLVLRTALQQETLVQLSQQDIQMLLQHSNFIP